MLLQKQRKSRNESAAGTNRIQISITFHGSAGSIRLIVGEDELTAAVIEKALKLYGQQGRLPVLGSDLNNFALYSPMGAALDPRMTIGSDGSRSFMLCKKPNMEEKINPNQSLKRKKGKKPWAWLNSLHLISKVPTM